MSSLTHDAGRRTAAATASFGFLLLALAVATEAQPTGEDFDRVWDAGIGSTVVGSLAQDQTGFLWAGTQGGLVRYDGYSFVVHRHAADDPETLDDSYVRSVFVDTDGAIWAGTQQGLCLYTAETTTFARFSLPESSGEQVLGTTSILDYRGKLLLASDAGLFEVDRAGRKLVPHGGPQDGRRERLVSIALASRDGTLWVGGHTGLYSKDTLEASFDLVMEAPKDDQVIGLFEDRDRRIWARRSSGALHIIDPASGTTLPLRLPASERLGGATAAWQGFAQPSDEEVWVGTHSGILVLDASSGAQLRTLLPGRFVLTLFVDDSGVVWAGIAGEGLVRYVPPNASFRMVREGLATRSVSSAEEVGDEVWIGTKGAGIYIWRSADDELRRVDVSRMTDPPNDGHVRDLLAAGESVWVAMNLSGVLRLDREGRLQDWLSTADGLPDHRVFCLARFGPDQILAGTIGGGLALIDTQRGSVAPAPLYNEDDEDWHPPMILGIATASDRIYLGGEGGLWEVPLEGEKRHLVHDPGDPTSIAHDSVMNLVVDRRERLWVGTREGLNLLEREEVGRARFKRFGSEAGLTNPFIDGLLEANDGAIWAATGVGLARVDPDTLELTLFDHGSGVPESGFWVGGHAKRADGTLMFASKEGLLMVAPEVTTWSYRPHVAVTNVVIDGRVQAGRPDELVLGPDQRDFSVEFSALDLSAPERNLYSYRLEGYDESWNDVDADHRVATFTNLDPGSYTLRVRGSNRSGSWSEDELRLPIVVQPAFSETWVFRGLVAVATVGLLLLAYLWRVRNLRAREVVLKQLVRQRTADLELANRRLERSASTDFLTGLPNRRGFTELAEAEIKRSNRTGHPLCFAMCDIDHFKRFNDDHGHDAGDFVLKSIAAFLGEQIRDSDSVGRWGGEEFIVLLPDTDLAGGATVAEKIRTLLAEQRWLCDAHELKTTVTIGVCRLDDGMDLSACVKHADEALYRGKREGRNRVVIASD